MNFWGYYMARLASWVGPILLDRGGIAFAAKFRGAAPRRAAPRSMRVDARRADHAYHDMSIRCHAMHAKFETRAGGTINLKYGYTEYYNSRRNMCHQDRPG